MAQLHKRLVGSQELRFESRNAAVRFVDDLVDLDELALGQLGDAHAHNRDLLRPVAAH